MRLRVLESDLYLTDCRTRIPFRFGNSTLTRAPLCTAWILVETEDGGRAEGYSSDLLVPKWFEKDPEKTAEEDVRLLLDSARRAGSALTAPGRSAATVFDHWWDLEQSLVESHHPDAPDRLVHGFGVALLERAMIDASCRHTETSFADAVRDDLLGFEPERVHAALRIWTARAALPTQPAELIAVRHTIGLLDPLRESDIEPGTRIDDGYPESLEADIRRYGLTHFKIKLGGDRHDDLARLHDIAGVFAAALDQPACVTLDGNEQFESLGDLADLLEDLEADEQGEHLLDGLLHIEQPLARDRTFDEPANEAMPRVAEFAPVIIDEADSGQDAFPRAVPLGYRGVSVKNCKGVFRALINRGLCDLSNGRFFQSAEDLTNLPLIALQQDLATVALLRLTHVERNGHHFFRGLDHLPASEARGALAAHPDLYTEDDRGISLRIESGNLRLGSLLRSGYGYAGLVDLDARIPADDWRWTD